MAVSFSSDFQLPSVALTHFWEHTIGSGHATLALRADWQAQLTRTQADLGIRHVRFHGLLCDGMGTLIEEGGKFIYSFYNADVICDFLLQIGMKPFVELSFMPTALASGHQTVFHYRANVSAPRDYEQWSELIGKLAQHFVDRYGIEEVRQWFFEVWNEPNLTAFGTGSQEDYFKLYRYTAKALKSVDSHLRVGGPATAANAWITEFLDFCASERVPCDFLSTHHYPTDSFGKPGDDTEGQLAQSRRSVLRDEAQRVRDQAGAMSVYYTEWCTSSNPRDHLHDDPYAAAFIVKTILEANGLVQGYSYWTFSDLFSENYFPSIPFQGGFGLQTIQGIAKPAYRAFQLLHDLGAQLLPVLGSHVTVDAWLARGAHRSTLVLTNFALPRHPIYAQTVEFSCAGVLKPRALVMRRIDEEHANAKRHWQKLGSPVYPTAATVQQLKAASELQDEVVPFKFADGVLTFKVEMPPQGVASVSFDQS